MKKYSNTIIQYEENIFYLKLCLNNIKKINKLSINRGLFQNKIKEDLIFIQKCIEILFEHLINNDKLIAKNEHLHSIHQLIQFYIEETEYLISIGFIKQNDFNDYINVNKLKLDNIAHLLSKIDTETNKEDLTTNEELNILFMENEQENCE